MMRDPMIPIVGDLVQYIWAMPGPDYDEGHIIKVHDDGSFDVRFPRLYIEKNALRTGLRFDDRSQHARCGSVRMVTRPGVNGF